MTGCGHGAMQGCGHLSAVLLAATAALGYWVLRNAEKDSGYVRWAGRGVGAILLLGGLAGFLCGTVSHMTGAGGMKGCNHDMMPQHGAQMAPPSAPDELPPGHPPIQRKKGK